MEITKFLDEHLVDFAIYDNYRMIGSYVDGLKPSMRKVVHVLDVMNIKSPVKVEQLTSKVAEATEYLHGAGSLAGVMVNMASTYAGTNNVNLLTPKGNFGTRCVQRAAAGRYIYTCKSEHFDRFFSKEDRPILIEQEFEGTIIEPRYFLPTLPLILVNGSEGVGNGYSQKILPRDPRVLTKAIEAYIKTGKLPKSIPPFFANFSGTVEATPDSSSSWTILGKVEKVDRTTLKITELPIGYDLEGYRKKLDELEDKKVIRDYTDKSDGKNKFCFIVKVDSEFVKKDERWQLDRLKLVRRHGENYTCLDENNAVREFSSEVEILKAYCDFRLAKYTNRKAYILEKIEADIKILNAKRMFIQKVNDGSIKILKQKKADLEAQLCKLSFEKQNDSYDYLLSMAIHSLTVEKAEEMLDKVSSLQRQREDMLKTTEVDMWCKDLSALKGMPK